MKQRLMILTAAAVPLAASLLPVAVNAATRDGGPTAATTCTAVPVSTPSGTRVVSVAATSRAGGDFTFPSTRGFRRIRRSWQCRTGVTSASS